MGFFDLLFLSIAWRMYKKHSSSGKIGGMLFFVLMFGLVNVLIVTGAVKNNSPDSKVDVRILAGIGVAIDALTVYLLFKRKIDGKKQGKTDLATKLYKLCLDNGIKGCDTAEDQTGIRLVAKNLGIKEKDAIDTYRKGIDGFKTEQKQAQAEQESSDRANKKIGVERAEESMKRELRKHSMLGKQKYLQPYVGFAQQTKNITNSTCRAWIMV